MKRIKNNVDIEDSSMALKEGQMWRYVVSWVGNLLKVLKHIRTVFKISVSLLILCQYTKGPEYD